MSLIAGFDDVMTHIRNQELRIQKLENENKELRKFKEDAEECCGSSVIMEKMLDEIETLKNKNDEYLETIERVKNKCEKISKQLFQETIDRCKIVDNLEDAIFELCVGCNIDDDIETIANHFDKLYNNVNISKDTQQCMLEALHNNDFRIMETDHFEGEYCEWDQLSVRNDYIDYMIERGNMDEDDDDVELLRGDNYNEYDIDLFLKWYCETNGIEYCYIDSGDSVFIRDV